MPNSSFRRLQANQIDGINAVRNYIANGAAASNTSGWATYSDAASNIPVDGTGGTATGLTFSRSTSNPLSLEASFTMVQANSTNLQGKGVSYDFTINSADQAKVLNISFTYNASSTFIASNGTTPPLNDGTTSTNAGNSDVEVFMYDVTNAVLIPVSPQVLVANGSNNFVFNGQFQTSSNSTSYRLIFHVATTSANATGWTLKFDDVMVSTQRQVQGPAVSDWVSYTPTLGAGFGTTTGVSFFYKREADNLIVKGSFTTGTVAASLGTISLPSGLSIDSSKVTINNTTAANGQQIGNYDAVAASTYGPIVTATGTSTSLVYTGANIGVNNNLTPTNASSPFSNSQLISVNFIVPIAGWSSNTVMSNDADTRVCTARYKIAGAGVTSSTTQPINFATLDYDTHSAVTTGSSWKFTAPISGYYNVVASLASTSGTPNVQLYKNGTVYSVMGPANSGNYNNSSSQIFLVAGDYIDLRFSSSLTVDSNTTQFVAISRISGPSTIGAADFIKASYYVSNATTTPGSSTQLNFDTKIFDSNSAVTVGSSWKFTAPSSGLYEVSGVVQYSTGGSGGAFYLYKNGSSLFYASGLYGTTSGTNVVVNIKLNIQLLAGDYIDLRPTNGATFVGGTGPYNSYINIVRLGN